MPSAVDQVTGKGEAMPTKLAHQRNRARRVTGGGQNLQLYTAPAKALKILQRLLDRYIARQ